MKCAAKQAAKVFVFFLLPLLWAARNNPRDKKEAAGFVQRPHACLRRPPTIMLHLHRKHIPPFQGSLLCSDF
jgi:hypothetical protein